MYFFLIYFSFIYIWVQYFSIPHQLSPISITTFLHIRTGQQISAYLSEAYTRTPSNLSLQFPLQFLMTQQKAPS